MNRWPGDEAGKETIRPGKRLLHSQTALSFSLRKASPDSIYIFWLCCIATNRLKKKYRVYDVPGSDIKER